MVVGITLLLVAIAAAGFFWVDYHTMHFNLPDMFIGAVVVIVALAVIAMLRDVLGVVDWLLGLL
jgi:hypothetical protein